MTQIYEPRSETTFGPDDGHNKHIDPATLLKSLPRVAIHESFGGVVGDMDTGVFNGLAKEWRLNGSVLASIVYDANPDRSTRHGVEALNVLTADQDDELARARAAVQDVVREVLPVVPVATQVEPVTNVRTQPEVTPSKKRERAPKFSIRAATLADIDDIVDVDIRAFDSVYREYDVSNVEWRAEMRDKFVRRLEKVGGEWMPVLIRDGKVVGFMTCCPTSKTPDEFESWEKTTDNGTLDDTYDPKGKNLYVVTLSVLPEGSHGKDMLFANQIGKMLREGYDMGFFESRMPGFRGWAKSRARADERELEDLSALELDVLAKQYFDETVTDENGKRVPLDRLLRLYHRVGCKLQKVVANAYQDKPSMNYGVVCVYDGGSLFDGSDLPFKLPNNRLTRWMFGCAMQAVGKSNKLTRKLF